MAFNEGFKPAGQSHAGVRQTVPARSQSRFFAVIRRVLIVIFIIASLLAEKVDAQSYETSVRATIPFCQKPPVQAVSFSNKPTAELCSHIVKKLAPTDIEFYADTILSVTNLFTLLAVLVTAYCTFRSIGDVRTTVQIGRYVNSYTRYCRNDGGL